MHRTLPGINRLDEAVEIYNKWSSPRRRQRLRHKYGYAMLAIRVFLKFVGGARAGGLEFVEICERGGRGVD